MDKNPEISVIIPFYNASDFINETIESVMNQSFSDWEIILVNDGSTDNSLDKVHSYLSEKIKLYSQTNKGVSEARNYGFLKSKGKYVVFLDADDLLSKYFLEKRYCFLEKNQNFGMCCGEIIMFQESIENIIWKHRGIYRTMVSSILCYRDCYESVPSNYMFRKKEVKSNLILFNLLLASTADKYYLLELSQKIKCGFVKEAPIWYRHHSKSMSSKLSKELVDDNELYYRLIDINNLCPSKIKKAYSFNKYYILGLSFLKIKQIKGIHYLSVGFIKHPVSFIFRFFSYLYRKVNAKRK